MARTHRAKVSDDFYYREFCYARVFTQPQGGHMGLLDSMLGAVSGGNTEGGALSAVMTNLLTQHGGVSGLLEKFQAGGLGQVAQSWVGTGQNLPISADQIQAVLGNEHVAELAGKLGIDPQQAAQHLSNFLPQLIDKLTPNGQLPADGNSNLAGALGKLFGA
jgi:uncharacterized protein YidB (DUF937 family)